MMGARFLLPLIFLVLNTGFLFSQDSQGSDLLERIRAKSQRNSKQIAELPNVENASWVAQDVEPKPEAVDPESELKALRAEHTDLQQRFDQLYLNVQEIRNEAKQAFSTRNYVPGSEFLPPSYDPRSLFRDEAAKTTNLGSGTDLGGGLLFRVSTLGRVQSWYDTGFVASGQNVVGSFIAPGSSPDIRQRGFYDLVKGSGNLILDLEKKVAEGQGRAASILELDVSDQGINFRQAYLRYYVPQFDIIAGTAWTAWTDERTLPRSLMDATTVAGGVFVPNVPQIRFTTFSPDNSLSASFAIQQPEVGDYLLVDSDDVFLQRYPELAARVRIENGYDSFAIGGIVRQLGREDSSFNEDFETGWGLSATGRLMLTTRTSLLYGAVGGQGVSNSIFGFNTTRASAGPTNLATNGGRLKTFGNYGGYLGSETIWHEGLWTNIAVGYAKTDTNNLLPTDAPRSSLNAWANLIKRVNQNIAVGFEYHYAGFQTRSFDTSENHRFLFTLQLQPTPQKKATDSQRDLATQLQSSGVPSAKAKSMADGMVHPRGDRSPTIENGNSVFPRF